MNFLFLKHKQTRILIFCLLLIGIVDKVVAQQTDENFVQNFKTPPETAKARSWWHWTRGNISKEGITHDLEWMKRVGIGGFQLADVNFGSGHVVVEKIMFGSPEWLNTVRHAAQEAERLDLEMALFSSAGWSLTGGPWVKPEQAMKKLVWSETHVEGPRTFSEKLVPPPQVIGPIRNMWRGSRPQTDPTFYDDHAVIAYLTPAHELELEEMVPETMVNGKVADGAALLDDDLNSSLGLPVDERSKTIVIDYHFPEPLSIQAATIACRARIPFGRLSVSQDQVNYEVLATLPGPQLYRSARVCTYAFPEQKAKYFRLEITAAPPSPAAVMSQASPNALTDSLKLLEFRLHSGARIHRWEDKAGFSFLFDYSTVNSQAVHADAAIDPEKIIDLTSRMDDEGHLDWEVPAGNWTILRTGYSLTGAKNRPAVAAGLGYESDKLSKEHTLSYIQNYLAPIKKELGPLFGQRLQYLLMDSWEAGMQNWTEKMGEEFQKRRGYDLLPYLPALSGHVVGSAEESDRFLWDFRRTLADMFAENFYAVISEYLHEQGIRTYSEASGVSLEVLEDALLCKKYIDIPMGEFWVRDLHPSAMYQVDVRGAASAAHVHGKTLVGAEAFTGGNYESPQTLKRVSDYWFTQGVNRLVFHTSTHQPLDTKPGNAMVGTHLHRNITWAEQATPFMTYIARNSFMLQQGKFVADIAYLLKEGAPSTMPFWGSGLNPTLPFGYNYDFVNADVLINRMSVNADGRIVLPDGMSYQILVLPQSTTMTIGSLRKIHDLVQQGATISGPKPQTMPGLETGDATLEFNQLRNSLWGDLDGISRTKNYVGKGRVMWGEHLADILEDLDIEPDVVYSRGLNTDIHWIHRRRDDADIYFISNQSDKPENIHVSFRLNEKQPELWHADNGKIEEVSYEMNQARTIVPLNLDAYGSVFVVFRKDAEVARLEFPEYRERVLMEVNAPWTIQFPKGWGAPETSTFQVLKSWTEVDDEGIKYFSGTASYHNRIKISKKMLQGENEIWLDLGEVRDLAEVYVNGRKVEILWKMPYQVEISSFVKAGENELRIDVTNEWTNRLAGDQDLPEDQRYLPAFGRRFGRKWEPEPSGLIGPVKIISRPTLYDRK